jgi:hypothetical protein
MNWIFHDSYKTLAAAQEAGEDIVKLGFAKGVKVSKTGKKSKPFMLFILPIKEREEK